MPTFHQDMGPIEENNHEKKICKKAQRSYKPHRQVNYKTIFVIFLYQRIKYFTLFYFRKYYTSNSTENNFKRN